MFSQLTFCNHERFITKNEPSLPRMHLKFRKEISHYICELRSITIHKATFNFTRNFNQSSFQRVLAQNSATSLFDHSLPVTFRNSLKTAGHTRIQGASIWHTR